MRLTWQAIDVSSTRNKAPDDSEWRGEARTLLDVAEPADIAHVPGRSELEAAAHAQENHHRVHDGLTHRLAEKGAELL